ncbi:MAG: hypothetical protein KIT22_08425 [Verrucomicrobiae bacterium]|nr:hypothetical protein [Verrucomicrobiae bacterium]
MKLNDAIQACAATLLSIGLFAATPARAGALSDLTVLVVGEERASEYAEFLRPEVAKVETSRRNGFDPASAAAFDVVLLDWQQTGNADDFPPRKSPLGRREDWNKPTVLVGSAGLNLAVVWQMRGGAGCTCLDPLAYGLRDHEIFEKPFKIERKMVRIPTPKDFRAEIQDAEIEVLPLAADSGRGWRPGWCTYSYGFAANPDIEYFCGGVNAKTPTAAGLWRQGNFMHFGFEQSPREMNETGRRILLNAIAYISRFTQDRPIAITPSPFAGKAPRDRRTLERWLRNPEYSMNLVESTLSPDLWTKLSPMGREKMADWAAENGRFLRPNAGTAQLEPDEDLAAFGLPFDDPKFFDVVIEALKNGEKDAEARRVLARYVPIGPKNGSAEDWRAWWQENKPYAFASDYADYRWYVDPLARKRGVPAAELRGPQRADTKENLAGK